MCVGGGGEGYNVIGKLKTSCCDTSGKHRYMLIGRKCNTFSVLFSDPITDDRLLGGEAEIL